MSLNYKLSTSRFAVAYFKDDSLIVDTKDIKKSVVGGWYTLQILHVKSDDEGTYCLQVEGIRSSGTRLYVKRMYIILVFKLFRTDNF